MKGNLLYRMVRTIFRLFFEAGYQAVLLYRISHIFYRSGVLRFFAFVFSRINISFTGADIHPACIIGPEFTIPHSVGIVIGQRCVIGRDCVIMQGVTLGAKGYPLRGDRHPTIGDRVKIFSHATILGPIEIGDDCTIGANAIVTKSIPCGSTVYGINVISEQSLD